MSVTRVETESGKRDKEAVRKPTHKTVPHRYSKQLGSRSGWGAGTESQAPKPAVAVQTAGAPTAARPRGPAPVAKRAHTAREAGLPLACLTGPEGKSAGREAEGSRHSRTHLGFLGLTERWRVILTKILFFLGTLQVTWLGTRLGRGHTSRPLQYPSLWEA